MYESEVLEPFTESNQKLKSYVHPDDWVNPTPEGRYNLVVIGAGTAGLVTAAGAAGLGAKVALIERGLMGGDCLNVGCVPSKGLLSAARVAATVRGASHFGVTGVSNSEVIFAEVMERMRSLRAGISHVDSAERFKSLGVDVYFGQGKFTSRETIEVAGTELTFRKAVIATGARAATLEVKGAGNSELLTNETIFSLTKLPTRLVVIGGGPIGSEMAQAFARFGSKVTLIEKSNQILSKEEPDAAAIVQKSLEADGVEIIFNAELLKFEDRDGDKVTTYRQHGKEHQILSDQILSGIGRAPNVEGLGLENAGVKYDTRQGVEVNDRLQTSNSNIYAAGDVASNYKFTHAADFMARTVIQNALFFGRKKLSDLVIPWCTYTSPELAHVGLTPESAKEQGIEIETYTQDFSEVDRAILEGQTAGFARVHLRKGSDEIVGATIVAENAGDMISEITLAMTNKLGLKKIASTIHPYPTQADAIRKLGDQYQRTRLTPTVKKLFATWLKWSR